MKYTLLAIDISYAVFDVLLAKSSA